MGLLGRPAEPAVRSQNPDSGTKRSPGRLLAVEADRPVHVQDEEAAANLAAGLVHPARMQQKDMLYTTHKGKKRLGKIQP